MVTREPYEDKQPRRRTLTPEQKQRYKARRQALAESEGYRSPYERRVARGVVGGRTPREAAGHADEAWDRAIAADPTEIIAEGSDRSPRTGKWRQVDYEFHYADGSTRTVSYRGRAISKEARRRRRQEIEAIDISLLADYIDIDLFQRQQRRGRRR